MSKINNEEQKILDSYENEEWESVSEIDAKKEYYLNIAKNTHLKNKRINIRLSEKILNDLKAKSLEEGIPYQSLITSILHKFTSGRLVEKPD
jgi:predicted DNA binding CopG/RHH family protein